MKKRFLMAGSVIMLCCLCGCLKITPLTEQEMDVVSEYAASLLLKYDVNYDSALYDMAEREARLTPTPTPTTKPKKPTPTPTPQEGQTSSGTTASPAETAKPTSAPVPGASVLYNQEETTKQLTELFGVEHVTVSCKGYELMKTVQSNEYFSLKAEAGRQYALVCFTLQNNTDSDITFDVSDRGLNYSFDLNTNTVFKAALSMLENDLQYMEIQVPANGTAEAVLAFEISDISETEIATVHLQIEDKEDNVVFVKLK